MKIGIIGSAEVGQTLARGFTQPATTFRSSRTPRSSPFSASSVFPPDPSRRWRRGATTSVCGPAAERKRCRTEEEDNLRGKVVIDTTNPSAMPLLTASSK